MDSIAHLFTNGNSESATVRARFRFEKNKVVGGDSPTIPHHTGKVGRTKKPCCFRKFVLGSRHFLGVVTAMDLRPLRRRALRTSRPALLRIRTRNPCVRRRGTLCGWYVRFITLLSHSQGAFLDHIYRMTVKLQPDQVQGIRAEGPCKRSSVSFPTFLRACVTAPEIRPQLRYVFRS